MMNFDPEMLKQLKKMDQKELTKKLKSAAELLGAGNLSERELKGICDNLGRMDEKELRRMAEGVDPGIINRIKNEFEG